MKLVLIISLLISSFAFAAGKAVEAGTYSAIDVETKKINATLIIRADNTMNFMVVSPDFTMPAPGCEGAYKTEENNFVADLKCPIDFLKEVQVQIDITKVTPENVRSEAGVDVEAGDPVSGGLKRCLSPALVAAKTVEHQLDHVALAVMRRGRMGEDR